MAALSMPWPIDGPAERQFGTVIVGSGFGGSVLAARLAAGAPDGAVVVLERGREVAPGGFPRRPAEVVAEVRTKAKPLGLFDFRPSSDLDIVAANAVGGGSLFYAGVTIEPMSDVFDSGWPAELTATQLRPYFDRVRAMLAVEKYLDRTDPVATHSDLAGSFAYDCDDRRHTDHAGRASAARPQLAKAAALRELALQWDTGSFRKVPIAVNLTRVTGRNEFGVPQAKCTLCGNCVLGCNVGAKNSLVTNYLPAARAAGALLYRQVEVHTVTASGRPGARWTVHATVRSARADREIRVHCRTLVLAGGTYGTAAMLAAATRRGGVRLSARLGDRLSGNGDTYFVTLDGARRLDAVGVSDDTRPGHEVGPTIVATIDLRADPAVGGLIQDGTLPVALLPALRVAVAARRPWRGVRDTPLADAMRRSQVWLAMGYDDASGRLVADRHGRLRARWPHSERQSLWRRLDAVFNRIAAQHGGIARAKLRPATPITVHPLGGAAMADDVDHGVTDHLGRVFDPDGGHHDGLYVADGSLCPTSLGANPSLTIAALAERIAEHLLAGSAPRRGAA